MGGRVGLFSTLVARLATCSGFMKDKGVRSAQTLSSDDLARIPARVAWWGPVSYQHLPIHDFPCAWFFGILGPVSYQHRPIYDFPCGAWFCGIFGPASCQHLIHDFPCASYWDIVNLSRTEGKREIFYLSIIARFFAILYFINNHWQEIVFLFGKRLYFLFALVCIFASACLNFGDSRQAWWAWAWASIAGSGQLWPMWAWTDVVPVVVISSV